MATRHTYERIVMTKIEETRITEEHGDNVLTAKRRRSPLWAALLLAAGVASGFALRPTSAHADEEAVQTTLLTSILQELVRIRIELEQQNEDGG